jgi:hypothetical protein
MDQDIIARGGARAAGCVKDCAGKKQQKKKR